jgi:hypothetical protein
LVNIVALKEMLPAARNFAQRVFSDASRKGNKARKKKARVAAMRSQALLYRYLTKEQKWSLRGTKSFEVTGQDGNTYRIRTQFGGNVERLDSETREPLYSYCVVPKYEVTGLPINDLLLAQKVLIETDVKSFLDIAVTRDLQRPRVEPEIRPGLDNAEREQAEAIRARRNATARSVGHILLHDIIVNEEARYDCSFWERGMNIPSGDVAFVLNSNHEVVPCFDEPFVVPPLLDSDVDTCVLELLLGVPAEHHKTMTSVLEHFRRMDLLIEKVLKHPETEDPNLPWVATITDERVPKGKVYCLAEDHLLGLVVHWNEGERRGYCIFNLNGVVVWDGDQEENQASQEGPAQENQAHTASEENQASQEGQGQEETTG